MTFRIATSGNLPPPSPGRAEAQLREGKAKWRTQKMCGWAALLGLGLLTTTGFSWTTPANAHHPQIAQVAAGEHHTCALDGTGRVSCWGANHTGQLGERVSDLLCNWDLVHVSREEQGR